MIIDLCFRRPTLGSLVLLFVAATQVAAQDFGRTNASSVDQARKAVLAQPSGSEFDTAVAVVEPQSNGAAAKPKPSSPMSAGQKLHYGLRQAFFTPTAYLGPAFGAYLTERAEVKAPGKTGGDKFADGLSRFAISFATNSNAQLLGYGVYPIIFKQDPRYKPSGKQGFLKRASYALGRTVLRQGDNGETQVNYSGLMGNLTSVVVANIYERDRVSKRDARGRPIAFDRHIGVGPTLISFGISEALEAASHIAFDEFNVTGRLRKLFGKH
jgi:hypothetical protein